MPFTHRDTPDPTSLTDATSVDRQSELAREANRGRKAFAERNRLPPPEPPRVVFVPVIVASIYTGTVGFYHLKRYWPFGVPDASGNIADSDVGTIATSNDAIGIYLQDFGLGAHTLRADGTLRLMGFLTNYASDGTPQYILTHSTQFGRFDVTQVGGSAGSSSAYCSFTYDVKNATGTVITSAVSPIFGRLVKAQMTAGTHGFGYNTPSGIVLLMVDEQVTTTACT